jgi:flavin reductase (DIM6/NTAB) family NADH-FMN oxidoreductase RutF
MKTYNKRDFPVSDVRRLLEPGPIVLVSSRHKGRANIMTMGWHMVIEFSPALIGCLISSGNHSHAMIRDSGECVINIPELPMAATVAKIGNCSGADTDKFKKFRLTADDGEEIEAPLIRECYANLECRLHDDALINRYNVFVFEVVKAHAPARPKYPKTIHYYGDGMFMVSGRSLDLRRYFRAGML